MPGPARPGDGDSAEGRQGAETLAVSAQLSPGTAAAGIEVAERVLAAQVERYALVRERQNRRDR
jgi:hypothetical protein